MGEGDEEAEAVNIENRMAAWGGMGSGNVGGFVYVDGNDPVEKARWTIQD